jgi:hypothetical protein
VEEIAASANETEQALDLERVKEALSSLSLEDR